MCGDQGDYLRWLFGGGTIYRNSEWYSIKYTENERKDYFRNKEYDELRQSWEAWGKEHFNTHCDITTGIYIKLKLCEFIN